MPPTPDDGWQIGPNPTVPSPEQLYEILVHFFNFYLFSVTSFLIYSLIVLLILWRVRSPTSYGTQSKYKHLHRFSSALLLVSSIFPILYAAMWIAKGTTSAGPDLPAGGVFGTSFEERVIGPDPTSHGLDQFLAIIINLFQAYFLSWTTLGVLALLFVVVLYYSSKWPMEYQIDVESRYARRVGFGVFMVVFVLPLLYLIVWIATGRQRTPGSSLPADGIFGTSFEERLIGPEVGQGMGGLVSALGNLFQTYQVTISFLFISLIVFLSVSYLIINWPFKYKLDNRQEHLYRAAMGLGGSLAMVPILHAISWVAVGLYNPEESFTRVSPAIHLPTDQLYGGPRYHPFIEEMAASKDPVETMLLNFVSFQSMTYLVVGIGVLALGTLMMLFFSKYSLVPSEMGYHNIHAGTVIIIVVFLLPGLVTASAWLATGTTHGGDAYSQNLAGSPFHQKDDFATCTHEGWEAKDGTSVPTKYKNKEGCSLEIHGTIVKKFDLTGTEHEKGFVDVMTSAEMTVRIYDGDELVVEEEIISNRRFDIPVTGVTTVEIEGDKSQLDSVSAGLRPLPDPYLVVELKTNQDEFILRNGVDADIRIYNIGEAGTEGRFNMTMAANGRLFGGGQGLATQKWYMDRLDGGEWREVPVTFEGMVDNRTVGEVTLVAATNWDDQDMLERGPGWDNVDSKTITITYANLESHLPEGGPVYQNTTEFDARVLNNGTAFSEASSGEVVIVDEEGNVVDRETLSIDELDPNEDSTTTISHIYRTPGTYTVKMNVNDELFPEGNQDELQYRIIHGDLRGDITRTDSTSRVGTTANFSVSIRNAGNDESDPTTADVEVVSPSGEVVDSWVVDVRNLSVGESIDREFTTTTDETGTYRVRLDVHYPEFSIGTTDSATIEGIGPDLRADATGNTIQKGEQTDISTRIRNHGTDYANPTTATVKLFDPNGTLINQTQIDVQGLDPGEEQVNTPFDLTLTETGTYEVTMDVQTEFETSGSSDSDEFNVVYEDLGVDVDAPDVDHSNENRVTVTVTNHGTGPSDATTVGVVVIDPNGNPVDRRTFNIQELDAGESTTRRMTVTHETAGTHTAEATLDVQTYHTDYSITWPNYHAQIDLTENETSGFQTQVKATILNVGPGSGGSTTAEIEVLDENNDVVDRVFVNTAGLQSGTQTSKLVTVEFPEVGTYTARMEVTDREFPDGNVDYTNEVTTMVPDLESNIQVSDIDEGGTARVNTTVVNTGEAENDPTTATVTLENPDGDVIETTEVNVSSLGPGEEQVNIPIKKTLYEPGRYVARIAVDDKYVPEGSNASTVFYVRGDDLRADITAIDIAEGGNADITTRITNAGDLVSESTTATVTIEDNIGRVVEQTQINVSSLEPGAEQVNTPLNVTLNEPGQYVARIDVDAQDNPQGSADGDAFRVRYVDLRGSVSASDVTTTNEGEVDVTIRNDGTGESDPVTATVQVVAEDGRVVEEWAISTGTLRGGRSYRRSFDFTVDQAGTYTAKVDVDDQGRPTGTTDSTKFEIRWLDLHADVAPSESVVEANETTVDLTISNNGPGSSTETTTRVYLYDSFGNVLTQKTVNIPSIAAGETYRADVPIHFVRPGVYSVGVRVSDDEFPAGNYAETTDFTVSHGNLHGSVGFRDDSTVVESETTLDVNIKNAGNDRSEVTTATLTIRNRHGTVVETRELEVGALNPGSSAYQSVNVVLSDSGKHTAHLNVHDEEFPIGTEDTDTIEALSPDLRADITVDDVELNHHTDATVTITNVGDAQSNPTIAEVRIFNQDNDRVVYEEVNVEALAPGETTEVTYSQLIDERCWKTEMSCAPGATVEAGTYTAEVNVQTQYAPQGTVATETFVVR